MMRREQRYAPIEERILFRRFTIPLAQRMKNSRITPNHVSVLGFALTLLAGVLLSRGEYVFYLLSVIILYFAFFCDKLDGDLARAKKTVSDLGAWLDSLLDRVGEIILIISIMIAISFSYLTFGILAMVFPLLFYYHHELTINHFHHGREPEPKNYLFAYGRCKHILLIMFFLIINHPEIALIALALGNVYLVALFANTIRKFRRKTKL